MTRQSEKRWCVISWCSPSDRRTVTASGWGTRDEAEQRKRSLDKRLCGHACSGQHTVRFLTKSEAQALDPIWIDLF